MSAITTGSVVDVATPRGLRTVIVASDNGTEIEGWEVSSRDHTSVTGAYKGLLDEALFPHDGERGLVIPLPDGGEIVAFANSDDTTIAIFSPHSRPRNVKRHAATVTKNLVTVLYSAEANLAADDILNHKEFYAKHITQVLGLDD